MQQSETKPMYTTVMQKKKARNKGLHVLIGPYGNKRRNKIYKTH